MNIFLCLLGSNHRDMSTCGAFHSIGSDLTRMRGRSDINQNGSIRSEQTISKTRDNGNTPISMAEVSAKLKSLILVSYFIESFYFDLTSIVQS